MLRALQNTANTAYRAIRSQPPKPKPPMKCFQQIVDDNVTTITRFRAAIMIIFVLRPILSIVVSGQLSLNDITIGSVLSAIIIPLILLVVVGIMALRVSPLYGNTVELKIIDPGHDLSLPGVGGWTDHYKDVILLLVATHMLTVTSPHFWYILVLMPMRIFYLAVLYILLPAIFSFANNGSRNNQCVRKHKKTLSNPKRYKCLRTIQHWHHFR